MFARTFRRAALPLALSALTLAGGCASSRSTELPFLPPSRPAQFSLAGIPWGIGKDSVTALLEPRGYNFNSIDSDGDMVFDGVLKRTPTRIYGYLANERLVKFRMVMLTPDETCLETYASARAELVKRYGAPEETTEVYGAGYGKANAEEAVRKGKATIRTHWIVGQGARQQHVAVAVNDNLTVLIDYNGPDWEKESLRRRRGGEPARASR